MEFMQALSIQQKFRFEISEMSRAQWNDTFSFHRPDPSHRAFGYCSCKQDTKEQYWGQTGQSGPPSKRSFSSRTKPKWSVSFVLIVTNIDFLLTISMSREMVTRINQMITKEKMLWSFSKLSQLLSKEMYEYQCGEFVCGYWGLKG